MRILILNDMRHDTTKRLPILQINHPSRSPRMPMRLRLVISPTRLEDRELEQIGVLFVALGVGAVELELGAAA